MIDKDEAIRLLRKEVANKGEAFVYKQPVIEGATNCAYFDEQHQPSCIVGHVIADTQQADSIARTGLNTCGVNTIHHAYPGLMTEHACQVFLVAQDAQDNGETWGTALEWSEKIYKELGGTE